MPNILYVVMSVQKWELASSPKNRIHIPFKLEMDTPMIGFLPVFDTLEAAEKEFPDFPITPMQKGSNATK